jgi:Flp pilus assembly protein TadD
LRPHFEGVAGYISLFAALVWLLHPLQTESVTYIVQRAESMAGMFYLVTLYCAVRGMESSGRGWYAAATVAAVLGMCSKAAMVTAPLAVLCYDRAFFSPSFGKALRKRWGLYAGLAGSWLVLAGFLLQARMLGVHHGTRDFTSWTFLCTEPGVILHYLRLAVWPSVLCLDYGWPPATTPAAIIPPMVVIAALLLAAVWTWRRVPELGYAGVWVLLTLGPSSSVFPLNDACYEHRMYLPLAALAAVFAAGGFLIVSRIFRNSGGRWTGAQVGGVLAVIIVLSLGARTYARNEDYSDAKVFWTKALKVAPWNSRIYNNLGGLYDLAGESQKAVLAFREAARLYPHEDVYERYLGTKAQQEGDFDSAVAHYQAAIRINPWSDQAFCRLGVLLNIKGRFAEAEQAFLKALGLNSFLPEAFQGLGLALMGQGRPSEAYDQFLWGWRMCPDSAEMHQCLGDALLRMGRYSEAAAAYRQALVLIPDMPVVLNNLSRLLSTQRGVAGADPGECLRLAQRACELTGNSQPEFLDTLAAAHAAGGDCAKAAQIADRAQTLASAAGKERMARSIGEHAARFRAGKPLWEPSDREGSPP